MEPKERKEKEKGGWETFSMAHDITYVMVLAQA